MNMISYAQNAEDVLVKRFFDGEEPQTYVDIGAAHPVYHSVTKYFYDNGWSGLNVEPRDKQFEMLKEERPKDENVQCCISSTSGELSFFKVEVKSVRSPDNGGLSTVDRQLAESYRKRGFKVKESRVPVVTLSELLKSQGIENIGFLKIDVEGHEAEVIAGMDWQRWRPRLVILESTLPLSTDLADARATNHLIENGYMLAFFDGLNQFFVRNEDEAKLPILSTPANVFDQYVPHEHLVQLAERDAIISELKGHSTKIGALNSLWSRVRAPFNTKKVA